MEGCNVSLARGVLGKGDKKTGQGEAGVTIGLLEQGSPRVIIDEMQESWLTIQQGA